MIYFITEGQQQLLASQKKAICSMVIGETYFAVWSILARDGWIQYAETYGYDLLIITQPLDMSPRAQERSPAWQKLLILSQPWSASYERIIWLDSDILIADHAPDIIHCLPDPRMVGVAGDQLSPAEAHIYFERLFNLPVHPNNADTAWQVVLKNDYERDGLSVPDGQEYVEYNTGVLVLTPALHRGLFEQVYALHGDTRLYEQVFLSDVLNRSGLVQRFTARYNWQLLPVIRLHHRSSSDMSQDEMLAFIRNEMRKAYFLHFAGCMELMKMLARWKHSDHVSL